MSVPLLLLHVRATVAGGSVADLEPLRDELRALAERHGETFAVRIKRREVSLKRADALLTVYEKLALTTTAREAERAQKKAERARRKK